MTIWWRSGVVMAALVVLAMASRGPTRAVEAIGAQAPADSLWALVLTTGPAWQAELPAGSQAGFGSHSRNLTRLRGEGRILFGGRYGGVGLLVFRASSEAQVRAMLEPDSTIETGVFATDIQVWRTIYDGVVPRR
jgi:hypothetical protein